MSLKFISVSFLMCLVICSCNKKDHTVKNKIDVSAITEAGVLGNGDGTVDNTDWNYDVTWTADEFSLFQAPPASQLDSAQKADVTFIFGYPNPIQTSVIFFVKATKTTLTEIVITDAMLLVKDRYFITLEPGDNPIQVNFDPAKYANNTNYRLYYSFYSKPDGLYFKGHGDVRINR